MWEMSKRVCEEWERSNAERKKWNVASAGFCSLKCNVTAYLPNALFCECFSTSVITTGYFFFTSPSSTLLLAITRSYPFDSTLHKHASSTAQTIISLSIQSESSDTAKKNKGLRFATVEFTPVQLYTSTPFKVDFRMDLRNYFSAKPKPKAASAPAAEPVCTRGRKKVL